MSRQECTPVGVGADTLRSARPADAALYIAEQTPQPPGKFYVYGATLSATGETTKVNEAPAIEVDETRAVKAAWGNHVKQASCQPGNMEEARAAIAELALYRAKPSSLRENGIRGRTSTEEMMEKLEPMLRIAANCGRCVVSSCTFKSELVVLNESQQPGEQHNQKTAETA